MLLTKPGQNAGQSRVANNAREALIHMILMMTVEEGLARVVGNEVDLSL